MSEGELQSADTLDVTALIKTVFDIQSVTVGGPQQLYLWRLYRPFEVG